MGIQVSSWGRLQNTGRFIMRIIIVHVRARGLRCGDSGIRGMMKVQYKSRHERDRYALL